jgi:outer membrane immunogenic protein
LAATGHGKTWRVTRKYPCHWAVAWERDAQTMIRALGTTMNALRLLLGTVMFVGGSLAARADGRPEPVVYTAKPPICCEVAYYGYDWSGFYLGGHAGVAFVSSEWTVPGLGVIATGTGGLIDTTSEFLEHSATGFAGGVHLGWQKQWGNTVAGLELTYTGLNTDVTSHTTVLGVPVARSSEVSNLLLVTGRLGYANDNILAYAKGGYASAEVEFDLRVGAAGVVGSSSDREHGWTAGVGLEYGIRDNVILGVEYNFVHLEVDSRTLVPSIAIANNGGVDVQSILARVSFKFGGRPDVVSAK